MTGSTSGIGEALVRLLVADGTDLVLVNRDADRSRALAEQLLAAFPDRHVDVMQADLADRRSLAAAADRLLAEHPRIDLLFNNAGVLVAGEQAAAAGTELHFEVNTVAPYVLTSLLRPALGAAGRSVVVATGGHNSLTGRLDPAVLPRPRRQRRLFGAYSQSKLALAMAFAARSADFAADGILLRVAEPGAIKTGMTAGGGMPTWLRLIGRPFFGTPAQGAHRIRRAATDPALGDRHGIHVHGGKVKALPPLARSPEAQGAIVELLEGITQEIRRSRASGRPSSARER